MFTKGSLVWLIQDNFRMTALCYYFFFRQSLYGLTHTKTATVYCRTVVSQWILFLIGRKLVFTEIFLPLTSTVIHSFRFVSILIRFSFSGIRNEAGYTSKFRISFLIWFSKWNFLIKLILLIFVIQFGRNGPIGNRSEWILRLGCFFCWMLSISFFLSILAVYLSALRDLKLYWWEKFVEFFFDKRDNYLVFFVDSLINFELKKEKKSKWLGFITDHFHVECQAKCPKRMKRTTQLHWTHSFRRRHMLVPVRQAIAECWYFSQTGEASVIFRTEPF